MADLIRELVGGVVDAALKEVLKKTGLDKSPTRRTRRKTTTGKKSAGGGLLADIVEAALGKAKKPARKPRKQVSRRRSAASRSRQRGA